ncbi:MAG: HAD-IIIA family hydrolase, partial [Pseudomonadota bacterium]|nr:HAD-IIIA family hydrolase [Pseudomonadota bacterium]
MTYSIDEDGTFCEIRDGVEKKNTLGRPALFLDRDGTIVEEVLYLHKPEDVKLLSGAVETIKIANQLSIPVIIVTNQSGIGRGYYGWKEFCRVQQKLNDELEKAGGN